MDKLVETIDKVNNFGVDISTDETIRDTITCKIDKRFLIDVIKNIIVQFTKESTISIQLDIQWIKKMGLEKDKGNSLPEIELSNE